MKIEIEGAAAPKTEYPYTGVHLDGTIVLFISPRQGICLRAGGSTNLYYFSESWAEEKFVNWEGVIKITTNNV